MDWGDKAHPVEQGIGILSAALFAAAIAYALALLGSPGGLVTALAASLAAFAAASLVIKRIGGGAASYRLPAFELAPLATSDPLEELLLLEKHIAIAARADELLLDDVLASLGPDSRVVRLFDPAHMPTAGELQANIDRHLRSPGRPSQPPDASQALSDALAELRRSLR